MMILFEIFWVLFNRKIELTNNRNLLNSKIEEYNKLCIQKKSYEQSVRPIITKLLIKIVVAVLFRVHGNASRRDF